MTICKLTGNVQNKECQYSISGVRSVYLANFAPGINYTKDSSGTITAIGLPNGATFFRIDPLNNSASWSDELVVNGNGGKYRTHTLNLTIGKYDADVLNQADALSLGKFIAIVVDKSGRIVLLGGTNGLSATSFNYASGAAEGDANGWTGVFAGTATETAPLVADETAITPVHPEPVITP